MTAGSSALFAGGTRYKAARGMAIRKLQRRITIAFVSLASLTMISVVVRKSLQSNALSSRVHPETARPSSLLNKDYRHTGAMEAIDTHVKSSLARVALLRRLFDQQRMASSYADLASPASAGLRAAAAAALDAASEPVFDKLATARKTAIEAVDDMIHRNQFPADCSNARLLLCSIDKDCGFACQLHHGVHLLALALATNRTLVLYAEDWRYGKNGVEGDDFADTGGTRDSSSGEEINDSGRSNDNEPNPNVWSRSHGIHTAAPASSWERVFARVTHCATGGDDWLATLPQFRRGQEHDEARAVVATVIDGEELPYDPPSVPRDVMQLVSGFHSRPEVWWVGALARYLLRPAPSSSASKKRSVDRGKRASRGPTRPASGPVHGHARSAHGQDRADSQ